ncbi:DUF1801 domain-containing protein [Mucilaginibacter sp. BT774]|uniref:DUF1801 domain-containing protein n=1 Tax=Mucilaginibacter sp. BT774 TaxID=3062276 RepID=UPI0026768535|nr:DUF1801 domain-containing protein [Mucilaginibacter sp. BT774]MDO3624560.1 DUF1801 domain-containing protein [Mucilaginibacter sp. BT774]
MQSTAKTPQEYIDSLPPDRKEVISKIRDVLVKNLPAGFEETIGYGMLGYVVPHSIYPKGYHCNPKVPLPYINLASQKNYIALYATCVYGDSKLKDWFVSEYPKHCKTRLDMGAGCIRFKKMDDIPYQLIGELAGKLTPQQWIEICERVMKR